MIISKRRTEDIARRDVILQIIETCLRTNNIEKAKEFGVFASELKKRIDTHDYSKDDSDEQRLSENDKKWEQITNPSHESPNPVLLKNLEVMDDVLREQDRISRSRRSRRLRRRRQQREEVLPLDSQMITEDRSKGRALTRQCLSGSPCSRVAPALRDKGSRPAPCPRARPEDRARPSRQGCDA